MEHLHQNFHISMPKKNIFRMTISFPKTAVLYPALAIFFLSLILIKIFALNLLAPSPLFALQISRRV